MERYFINQKNHTTATIGGVRRLKEFTPELIQVGVFGADIRIVGEKLSIASFHENEINVTGKIANIETIKTSTRGGI